jgi:hypothetical protein
MVNRIICAKWGTLYSDASVNALYEKVKAQCTVPFEFEVFTEFDNSWEDYKWKHYRASLEPDSRFDAVQNNYHRDDFGGIPHYRKITLFNEDKKFDPTDTILYLDIDTEVPGDPGYFFEELNDDKPYIVWNYWWEDKPEEWLRQYHVTRCPLFNSSVLRWKPGQNQAIYDFVDNYTDRCFFTYPSMDTFMFHNFGPRFEDKCPDRKEHFQFYDKGVVTSERVLTDTDKHGIIHMLEGLTIKEKSQYAHD